MKLSTRLAGIFYTCILLLLSIRIAAAQENPPLLKNIHAEAISETEIAISWTMPSPLPSGNNAVKQIWLYRDTQPIALRSRIEALVPIAKLAADTTSYTDVILDYREYYYAITAVTADDFQYNLILPAINALVRPTLNFFDISMTSFLIISQVHNNAIKKEKPFTI